MSERESERSQDDAEQTAGEELEQQDGELLPRREVMSTIDIGEGGPIYSLPVEPRN